MYFIFVFNFRISLLYFTFVFDFRNWVVQFRIISCFFHLLQFYVSLFIFLFIRSNFSPSCFQSVCHWHVFANYQCFLLHLSCLDYFHWPDLILCVCIVFKLLRKTENCDVCKTNDIVKSFFLSNKSKNHFSSCSFLLWARHHRLKSWSLQSHYHRFDRHDA